MNNSRLILIFLLSYTGEIIFSQQLSHQVLVPVAGVVSGSALNYSQTIGETAVEVVSGSGFVLSQGFQQPAIHVKATREIPKGDGVNVYPNPATDFINVEFFGETGRAFRIDVLNIAGTVMLTERLNFQVNYWFIKEIQVSQLIKGAYLVRIASHDGFIKRTFVIQKL